MNTSLYKHKVGKVANDAIPYKKKKIYDVSETIDKNTDQPRDTYGEYKYKWYPLITSLERDEIWMYYYTHLYTYGFI